MEQEQIDKQIKTIRDMTAKLLAEGPESCKQFLIEAGILKENLFEYNKVDRQGDSFAGFNAKTNIQGYESCRVILVDHDNVMWGTKAQKITKPMSLEDYYELYRLCLVKFKELTQEQREGHIGRLIFDLLRRLEKPIRNYQLAEAARRRLLRQNVHEYRATPQLGVKGWRLIE